MFSSVYINLIIFCAFFRTGFAARLSAGDAIWFESETCPPGFLELTDARGRAVLPTTGANGVGFTLYTSLGNNQEPIHSHSLSAMSATFGSNSASQDVQSSCGTGCAGGVYSKQGTYSATGSASIGNSKSSGLSFAQLTLCYVDSLNIDLSVPEGTLVYRHATQTSCGTDFVEKTAAEGRFLVSARQTVADGKTDGEFLPNSMVKVDTSTTAGLTKHSHSQDVVVPLGCLHMSGSCCFTDAAAYSAAGSTLTGTTGDESLKLPYIQLLACEAATAPETSNPPINGLFLTKYNSCPGGWEKTSDDLDGRIFIGRPLNGDSRSLFGTAGLPLAIDGIDTDISHTHTITGVRFTLDWTKGAGGSSSTCSGQTDKIFTSAGSGVSQSPGDYDVSDSVSSISSSNIPYSVVLGCTPDYSIVAASCNFACYFEKFKVQNGWNNQIEAEAYYRSTGYYNADVCTCAPTSQPSSTPTRDPTKAPTTTEPTSNPSQAPTSSQPTNNPTKAPLTSKPTTSPTIAPVTSKPTSNPTKTPTTSKPTNNPTRRPTTSKPTNIPTVSPTTSKPTSGPSQRPTTSTPTAGPTQVPTTSKPTLSPSTSPTSSPSTSLPTSSPTSSPTRSPLPSNSTDYPTKSPVTSVPTSFPTKTPSLAPSDSPTSTPSISPTDIPTGAPTSSPDSLVPTSSPTTPTLENATKNPDDDEVGESNLNDLLIFVGLSIGGMFVFALVVSKVILRFRRKNRYMKKSRSQGSYIFNPSDESDFPGNFEVENPRYSMNTKYGFQRNEANFARKKKNIRIPSLRHNFQKKPPPLAPPALPFQTSQITGATFPPPGFAGMNAHTDSQIQ